MGRVARSGPYRRASEVFVGPHSNIGSLSLGTVSADATVAPDGFTILTSDGRMASLPPSKMSR